VSIPSRPRSHRHAICGVLAAAVVSGPWAQASQSRPPDIAVNELVERATAYVEDYETKLSYLIASETYRQYEGTFGAGTQAQRGFPTAATSRISRVMRGEFFLTFAPAARAWIAIRDVAEVDGKPVADRQDLQALLHENSIGTVAQELKEHNARFNIGRVERNFNEPTFALQALERRNVSRFRFVLAGINRRGRTAVATLKFTEHDTPTLVVDGLDPNRAIFSSGEFSVEADTGRVHQTIVTFQDPTLNGQLATEYVLDSELALWLPSRFTENWIEPNGMVTGDARYSDWHRFEVRSRIR
jgi:hypothetical protein